MSAVLQDEEGQILEAHSISAGLDYPGSVPSTRSCATAAGHLRGGHRRQAVTRSSGSAASRGSSGARVLPRAGVAPRELRTGAGPRHAVRARDKDLDEVLSLGDRIAAAFASHGEGRR